MPNEQVQQWIAQNPLFAKEVAAAMSGSGGQYNPSTMQLSSNPVPAFNQPRYGSFTSTPPILTRPVQQSVMSPIMPTPTPVPQASGQNNFNSLTGRVINDANDIKPFEVPGTGEYAFFPMVDGSCVYAKTWANDGSIKTVRFVPEVVQAPQQTPEPKDDRVDQLSERLTKIENLLTKAAAASKHARDTQANSESFYTEVESNGR